MSFLSRHRGGPIGVDLGSHSVKLVQFRADRSDILEAASWDFPDARSDSTGGDDELAEKLHRTLEGRRFRGREAVICISGEQLFLQNVRVPKAEGKALQRAVHQEAAGRLPYPMADAEIRFLEAGDVRQGDQALREVIVVATQRQQLASTLKQVEKAGLRPIAVEIEPLAILRSLVRQFRRDDDRQQRTMYVQIGYCRTTVVIAEGEHALFIKCLDVGGRNLDQAVADTFEMPLEKAAALRRNNGDRRSDRRDAEITASVARATRPVLDSLFDDLDRCVRYHSVTFRGKPLARTVLSGGEACSALAELMHQRLDLACELGEPLRGYSASDPLGRAGKWDVAAGLALHEAAPK